MHYGNFVRGCLTKGCLKSVSFAYQESRAVPARSDPRSALISLWQLFRPLVGSGRHAPALFPRCKFNLAHANVLPRFGPAQCRL